MLALRIEQLRHPLVARELTPESLAEGELRIQVDACAVCGTDLKSMVEHLKSQGRSDLL